MGSSGTESKVPSKIEALKENIQKEQPEKVKRNNTINIHKSHLRLNESIINRSKSFVKSEPENSIKNFAPHPQK